MGYGRIPGPYGKGIMFGCVMNPGSLGIYPDLADEFPHLNLRSHPPRSQEGVSDWEEAQDVFFAWVRKAYKKSLGEDVDVSKLIKSQMSERLKTALQQVKVDYGKTFRYGGFNPRPIKLDGYRHGTISEHGTGTAIDVESGKNAHI